MIEMKIQKAEAANIPYLLRAILNVSSVYRMYSPIITGMIPKVSSEKYDANTANALLLAKLSNGSNNHNPQAIKSIELDSSKKSVCVPNINCLILSSM